MFYGSIVVWGGLAIVGLAIWLKCIDKKAAKVTYKNSTPVNPLPQELQFPPTGINIREIEHEIPIGCKKAVVCSWGDDFRPKIAAFRAKGGNGKIVTAEVVKQFGLTLTLRHKPSEPTFERSLVV